MLHKYAVRTYIVMLSMPFVLLVSACQNNEQTKTMASQPVQPRAAPVLSPATSVTIENKKNSQGMVSSCQRELLALSKINPKVYAIRKAAFDELLSNASVYTSVRDDIGGGTKDTMDALYKYKTQKLCSDIEQSVRQTLISREEGVKR